MPDFRQVLDQIWHADVLWLALFASSLAQFLKPFVYKLRTGEFDWHHIAGTGGMPSSHSAMVSALATGVGLDNGFDSSVFAVAAIFAMIVTYDASGVRQQAGHHARAINMIVAELLTGHPLEEIKFEELLGHSRIEVGAGVLFGIAIMLVWKLLIQPLVGG
jgi:acid phosphatase family membrane protein YuiD